MAETTRWYRGNLHMHSFWSDGGHFPEVIADRFKAQGYDFIAFTEHDQHQAGERWVSTDATQRRGMILQQGNLLPEYLERFGPGWVEQRRDAGGTPEVRLKALHEYRHLFEEPDRFLLLNGEEITVKWPGGTHWINTLNAPEVIPPQATRGSSEVAMQVTFDAAGRLAASGRTIITSLNHPNYRWNATAEDIAAVRGLRFMEVHTALSSCASYGDALHPSAERIWDIVLSLRLGRVGGAPAASSPSGSGVPADGGILFGLVSDDCHSYHANDTINGGGGGEALPFRAWMMVRSSRLTPEYIMGAVGRGDFYGSSGVTLRTLDYSGGSLALSIEPEAGVRYAIRFIGTRRGADLRGTPVVDERGATVRTTRQYSDAIGATLKEVHGTEARYDLTGDELYVRALVVSDKPHPNPTIPGDVCKAWTQPRSPEA